MLCSNRSAHRVVAQNLVKRDKDGYKEEFLQQQRNYLSELEIFKLKVQDRGGVTSKLILISFSLRVCWSRPSR